MIKYTKVDMYRKDMQELRLLLEKDKNIPDKYYVAVESNIFDKENYCIIFRKKELLAKCKLISTIKS